MKRYVIERNIPGVQRLGAEGRRGASATSNAALAQLSGKVHWVHSYVVEDKTFCVYLADSPQTIQEHARLSGFPANKVSEVHSIIEPETANA